MAVLYPGGATVNNQDEQFFRALGARVATARKAQNLTQQQMADRLGIAQQTFAQYEAGNVRFPASILPLLGQVLGLAPEELLGQEIPKSKRGPTPRLQQQIERIGQLPRTKQAFVMEMLETVIAQAGH